MRSGTALVIDDHEIFRAGLAALLARDLGFREVFEAASFAEAWEVLSQNPDIQFATFDLAMPGMEGAATLQAVYRSFPSVRLAVVTASVRREDILEALAAGASGYVPKTLGISDIARALRTVLEGQIFVPPNVGNLLTCSNEPRSEQFQALVADGDLSLRQRDVLRLLAEANPTRKSLECLI